MKKWEIVVIRSAGLTTVPRDLIERTADSLGVTGSPEDKFKRVFSMLLENPDLQLPSDVAGLLAKGLYEIFKQFADKEKARARVIALRPSVLGTSFVSRADGLELLRKHYPRRLDDMPSANVNPATNVNPLTNVSPATNVSPLTNVSNKTPTRTSKAAVAGVVGLLLLAGGGTLLALRDRREHYRAPRRPNRA